MRRIPIRRFLGLQRKEDSLVPAYTRAQSCLSVPLHKEDILSRLTE